MARKLLASTLPSNIEVYCKKEGSFIYIDGTLKILNINTQKETLLDSNIEQIFSRKYTISTLGDKYFIVQVDNTITIYNTVQYLKMFYITPNYKKVKVYGSTIGVLYENKICTYCIESTLSIESTEISFIFKSEVSQSESIVDFTLMNGEIYLLSKGGNIYSISKDFPILNIPLLMSPEPESFIFVSALSIESIFYQCKKYIVILYEGGIEFYEALTHQHLLLKFKYKDSVKCISKDGNRLYLNCIDKVVLIEDYFAPKIVFCGQISSLKYNTFISNGILYTHCEDQDSVFSKEIHYSERSTIKKRVEDLFYPINNINTKKEEVYLFHLNRIYLELESLNKTFTLKCDILSGKYKEFKTKEYEVEKKRKEIGSKIENLKSRFTAVNFYNTGIKYDLQGVNGKHIVELKTQRLLLRNIRDRLRK